MNFSSVNFVSAFVAAIVMYIFGFLWYSPFLWGLAWMNGVGHDLESLQPQVFSLILSFVLNFIYAVVIAVFAGALGCRKWKGAFLLSLWLGIGISLTNMVGGYLFLPFPIEVAFIDITYVFLRTFIACCFACLWIKQKATR